MIKVSLIKVQYRNDRKPGAEEWDDGWRGYFSMRWCSTGEKKLRFIDLNIMRREDSSLYFSNSRSPSHAKYSDEKLEEMSLALSTQVFSKWLKDIVATVDKAKTTTEGNTPKWKSFLKHTKANGVATSFWSKVMREVKSEEGSSKGKATQKEDTNRNKKGEDTQERLEV